MVQTSRLATKLHRLITGPVERMPEHRRFYGVAGLYSSLGGLAYHAAMIPVFFLLGIWELGLLNILSVAIFSASHYIATRDKFHHTGLLNSLEILVHQSAAIYYLGLAAGFQFLYLVLVLVVFIVPTEFRRPTYPLLFITPVVGIAMYLYASNHSPVYNPGSTTLAILYAVNFTCFVVFLVTSMGLIAYFAEEALETAGRERARADRLLLNILPAPIATRLKNSDSTIADEIPEASILFCDIVDFTTMSSAMSAEEVVTVLNELFSRIDSMLDDHSMEKIKTIGDAYMAVSGVPNPVPEHAQHAIRFGLAIQRELALFNKDHGTSLQLRYGVHSGPVVAGVIGIRRFIYDLWGDTVNTASRMESYGIADRIQVTEQSYMILREDFEFDYRGEIEVKGKGRMRTYILRQQGE